MNSLQIRFQHAAFYIWCKCTTLMVYVLLFIFIISFLVGYSHKNSLSRLFTIVQANLMYAGQTIFLLLLFFPLCFIPCWKVGIHERNDRSLRNGAIHLRFYLILLIAIWNFFQSKCSNYYFLRGHNVWLVLSWINTSRSCNYWNSTVVLHTPYYKKCQENVPRQPSIPSCIHVRDYVSSPFW